MDFLGLASISNWGVAKETVGIYFPSHPCLYHTSLSCSCPYGARCKSHTQRVCLCFECVFSVFCVCTYTNIRRPGNGTWGSRTPTKTWICMSAKSANRTHRWQLSCPLPRRTKRKKWVGSKLCSPRWVLRVRMYGCGCLCGWIGRVGG